MSVKPYKINVPQEKLNDLQDRLKHTRWTDEFEGVSWEFGVVHLSFW